MNTRNAVNEAIVPADSSIDSELGIDVGATYKNFLRDQRIEALTSGRRRSRKARGSNRPHNQTVPVVRSNAVTTTGNGEDLDAVIPGTTWTWRDALSMKKECERDIRLFGRTNYVHPTNAIVVFTRDNGADFEPFIPEGCKPEDIIPGSGGWTWGDALEESRSRMHKRDAD